VFDVNLSSLGVAAPAVAEPQETAKVKDTMSNDTAPADLDSDCAPVRSISRQHTLFGARADASRRALSWRNSSNVPWTTHAGCNVGRALDGTVR